MTARHSSRRSSGTAASNRIHSGSATVSSAVAGWAAAGSAAAGSAAAPAAGSARRQACRAGRGKSRSVVGAAGGEVELQQRDARPRRQGAVRGERRAAVGAHGHLPAPLAVAADRRVDDAAGGGRLAVDDRQVPLGHGAAGESPAQAKVGGGGARRHHDAAGAAVETVHDSRAARPADPGHLGVARQQQVGEGAGRAAGSRVHRQAGRLVEHDQLRVFVQHRQLACLRHHRFQARRGRTALDAVAGRHHVGGLGRAVVEPDVAGPDPLLDLVAGQLVGGGEMAVEALAGAAARTGADGPGAGGAQWPRRANRLSIAISAMPIEIAASATLKDGQWCAPT